MKGAVCPLLAERTIKEPSFNVRKWPGAVVGDGLASRPVLTHFGSKYVPRTPYTLSAGMSEVGAVGRPALDGYGETDDREDELI